MNAKSAGNAIHASRVFRRATNGEMNSTAETEHANISTGQLIYAPFESRPIICSNVMYYNSVLKDTMTREEFDEFLNKYCELIRSEKI